MAGRVTRKKVWSGPAPSVAAACSCSVPISRRTGMVSRTTNGSETNIVARIIPGTEKMIRMPFSASQSPTQPSRLP